MRVTDVKDSPGLSSRLQQPQTIALFLETPVAPATELPPINKTFILLFLKFYNPKTQSLQVSAGSALPVCCACARQGIQHTPRLASFYCHEVSSLQRQH